jgi:hypothetical protein
VDHAAHQWQASVAGALCRASRWCAAASLLITATAFAAGIAVEAGRAPAAGLALIVAAGAPQIYLAVRIEFDRRIFDLVAAAPQGWSGFDGAMRELGLMRADKAGRPPAERVAGLAALVRWHAGLLATQLLLVLVLVLAA